MSEDGCARANLDRTSAGLRAQLVDELRDGGWLRSGRVIAAFSAVERERFIPEVLRNHGIGAVYRDDAHAIKIDSQGVPLSSSSQPAIMAEMLEMLGAQPGQRVLEIGTGSGYNAAILEHIVGPGGDVTTLDIDHEVVSRARRTLTKARSRVEVAVTDGRAGWPFGAPYDRIIVTASSAGVPAAWLSQLVEGGRLAVPLRLDPTVGAIQLIPVFERRGARLVSVAMTWGGFMPLHAGDGGWPRPAASLGAGRSCADGHRSFASVSGRGVEQLRDPVARTVLASALHAASPPRQKGSEELRSGEPPFLIIYLLLRTPEVRRVWIETEGRLGIGIVDNRGRGVAVLSVPSERIQARPREPGTAKNPLARQPGRIEWRIDGYGDDLEASAELEGILRDWVEMHRAGQTKLEITVRTDGNDTLGPRFRWVPA